MGGFKRLCLFIFGVAGLPVVVYPSMADSATVYSTSVPSAPEMIDGVSYVVADEAALANLMRIIDSGGDPGTPVN